MSYTPLDGGIVTSTLLRNGPDVVACWVLLLATCDRLGESSMQPSAAAGLLRISDERAKAAFLILQEPDLESRNKDHEGRRIIALPGGNWHVVSHQKYQWLASKARAAQRQRKYEAAKKAREAEAAKQESSAASFPPPAAAVPVEGGMGGGPPRPPGPANPLIQGRRPDMENEGYRLIREIHAIEPDRDPTEILLEAAKWETKGGGFKTKVRLETMSDDHLIRTVHDLKTNLEAAKEEHAAQNRRR